MQDPHAAGVVGGRAEADACAKEDAEGAVQGDYGGSAVVGCSMVAVAMYEDDAVADGHGEEHLCGRMESERTVHEGVGR